MTDAAPKPTPADFRRALAMMTDEEILQLLAFFRLGLLCFVADQVTPIPASDV